jgi:YegS/Rv2252/BmrU family lipid kinase
MFKKVRVIINPNSGVHISQHHWFNPIQKFWDLESRQLTYQFSKSPEDCRRKVRDAIEEGVECILSVGGDGLMNCIGAELVGTDVVLGVIPAGSGNGFARHFNIPLQEEKAIESLVTGEILEIDVGLVNGRYFFVTCSMAWDAALVRSVEKAPIRGVLPYFLAAAVETFQYKPGRFTFSTDDSAEMVFNKPMIFTVANLTQYGGGARIAPRACPNDGFLELVAMGQEDMAKRVHLLHKLFDGTVEEVPEVFKDRFKKLVVRREFPGSIQVDGELVEEGQDICIEVKQRGLKVLVPKGYKERR